MDDAMRKLRSEIDTELIEEILSLRAELGTYKRQNREFDTLNSDLIDRAEKAEAEADLYQLREVVDRPMLFVGFHGDDVVETCGPQPHNPSDVAYVPLYEKDSAVNALDVLMREREQVGNALGERTQERDDALDDARRSHNLVVQFQKDGAKMRVLLDRAIEIVKGGE